MTVSRALRNQRSISLKTRERVQALARKLGYQPNPLLSIFQAHVRSRHQPRYQATIAWINDSNEEGHWRKQPYTKGLLDGARARAEELGYRLDEIWLDKIEPSNPKKNIARFSRVLRTRGIFGVVLPLAASYQHAFYVWPDVAVAVIGLYHSMAVKEGSAQNLSNENIYHTATFDYFANMRLTCERLRALGYKRIGLVISDWLNAHTDTQYSGSYLAQQRGWPKSEHVTILFEDNINLEPTPSFQKWLKRQQPDVVICSQNQAMSWLEKSGLRVPADIGLAHLYLADDVKGWSGVNPAMTNIGAAAVELVVQQLRLNQRTPPSTCHELFLPGRWVEGKTTGKTGKPYGKSELQVASK